MTRTEWAAGEERVNIYRFVPAGGTAADEVIWDVTLMLAGTVLGTLGPPRRFPMIDVRRTPIGPGVERDAVEALKRGPRKALDVPVLLVELRAPPWIDAALLRVFVDGNHRATARKELGYRDFHAYVIGAEREGAYRVAPDLLAHIHRTGGEAPPPAVLGVVRKERAS